MLPQDASLYAAALRRRPAQCDIGGRAGALDYLIVSDARCDTNALRTCNRCADE
jgi:hypothetical protein